MSEIIKVKSSRMTKYEELLMKRDRMKKEAFQYSREYTAVFGSLIIQVFEKKIACIRLKKSISFCQKMINRGGKVDEQALQEFLKKEMEQFQRQMDDLVEEKKAAEGRSQITETELLEIKRIYRRLVKRMHPDMNPKAAESPELSDLWNRIVIDYTCNNLKGLQEDEVLANRLLEQLQMDNQDIEIPDLEVRIALLEGEISQIENTDPYQYRYLLADEELIQEKKDSLGEELAEYEEYERQLKKLYDEIRKSGGESTWRMN